MNVCVLKSLISGYLFKQYLGRGFLKTKFNSLFLLLNFMCYFFAQSILKNFDSQKHISIQNRVQLLNIGQNWKIELIASGR